jgi:hypothetical protein
MARTIHRSNTRKIKKSVTLSPESVKFLVAARRKSRALSLSSVLEAIVRDARLEQERAAIEKSMEEYYDSLTPEEIAEDRAWGEFATQQLLSSKDIW